MFLSTQRFNHLFDMDSKFKSFWDNYDQFFSTSMTPRELSLSQEDRLNKQFSVLKNFEDEFLNNINSFESEFEQLKNFNTSFEQKMKEVQEKKSMIHEEKLKQLENSTPGQDEQSYVLKRSHYKNNDMEIEEQYDSRNPDKCYKIIKKQGEQPQIMYKQEKQAQIKSN